MHEFHNKRKRNAHYVYSAKISLAIFFFFIYFFTFFFFILFRLLIVRFGKLCVSTNEIFCIVFYYCFHMLFHNNFPIAWIVVVENENICTKFLFTALRLVTALRSENSLVLQLRMGSRNKGKEKLCQWREMNMSIKLCVLSAHKIPYTHESL